MSLELLSALRALSSRLSTFSDALDENFKHQPMSASQTKTAIEKADVLEKFGEEKLMMRLAKSPYRKVIFVTETERKTDRLTRDHPEWNLLQLKKVTDPTRSLSLREFYQLCSDLGDEGHGHVLPMVGGKLLSPDFGFVSLPMDKRLLLARTPHLNPFLRKKEIVDQINDQLNQQSATNWSQGRQVEFVLEALTQAFGHEDSARGCNVYLVGGTLYTPSKLVSTAADLAIASFGVPYSHAQRKELKSKINKMGKLFERSKVNGKPTLIEVPEGNGRIKDINDFVTVIKSRLLGLDS